MPVAQNVSYVEMISKEPFPFEDFFPRYTKDFIAASKSHVTALTKLYDFVLSYTIPILSYMIFLG